MKVAKSSRISGFHALSTEERLARVAGFCDLDKETVAQLRKYGDLDAELANRLIENVIGTISLPVGIATNMKIDGQDVLIRSEEHTSELQSRGHLVCRLLLEKKKQKNK